ncbi:SEL1-like repeat protein [Kiloniella laminariae]|uniref:SEL1-like repeat protein n=1 Tax=Kiloniella laminariae TaxID=454162 RepID=A0ABT4LEX5_9PROT|nr:SEL1-like repeat protein [Kiloniella laminariae]MCZ4279649.1 SEL1-like repeat protein [Kiloniella laminariae]
MLPRLLLRLCTPALLSGFLFLLPVAPAVAITQQEAMQAMTQGDFATAFVFFHEHAEAGNPAAQYLVGYMTERGTGTEQNQEQAIHWYRKAAEQGNPDAKQSLARLQLMEEASSKSMTPDQKQFEQTLKKAQAGDAGSQFELAGLYHKGIGTDRDIPVAFEWYLRAAAQGYDEAQYVLGKAYLAGEEVPADPATGIRYLAAAAIQDHIPSLFYLGNQYLNGNDNTYALVRQDTDKGIQLLTRAADLGSSDAQFNLGIHYGDKRNKDHDLATSLKWHLLTAEQGNEIAMHELGRLYLKRNTEFHSPDLSFQWFKRSADLDFDMAFYPLGLMYQEGIGTPKDSGLASFWLEKGAKADDRDAQYFLATLHLNGEGVEQDYEKAVRWFKAAAQQDLVKAQYELALLYEKGLGTAPDPKQAVAWMKRAAEQDHEPALLDLARYYEEGLLVPRDDRIAQDWFRRAEKLGSAEGARHNTRIEEQFARKAHEKKTQAAAEQPSGELPPATGDTDEKLGFFDALERAIAARKRTGSQNQSLFQKLFGPDEDEDAAEYNDAPGKDDSSTGEQGTSEYSTRQEQLSPDISQEAGPDSGPDSENNTGQIASSPPANTTKQQETFDKSQVPFPKRKPEITVTPLQRLLRAAEGGDPEAQFIVSTRYFDGEGVKRDTDKATYWLGKSAEQGYQPALDLIGLILSEQVNPYQDPPQPTEESSRQSSGFDAEQKSKDHLDSATPKTPEDFLNVGRAYYHDSDLVNAFVMIKIAAEDGHEDAQFLLSRMYQEGQGTPQDSSQAFFWIRKAAEQGSATYQYFLGHSYENGSGTAANRSEALKWFRKAADQNLPEAQFALGYLYINRITPPDFAEGFHWTLAAAKQSLPEAEYQMGEIFQKGLGRPGDLQEATYWYGQSADHGLEAAQKRLDEIKALLESRKKTN